MFNFKAVTVPTGNGNPVDATVPLATRVGKPVPIDTAVPVPLGATLPLTEYGPGHPWETGEFPLPYCRAAPMIGKGHPVPAGGETPVPVGRKVAFASPSCLGERFWRASEMPSISNERRNPKALEYHEAVKENDQFWDCTLILSKAYHRRLPKRKTGQCKSWTRLKCAF